MLPFDTLRIWFHVIHCMENGPYKYNPSLPSPLFEFEGAIAKNTSIAPSQLRSGVGVTGVLQILKWDAWCFDPICKNQKEKNTKKIVTKKAVYAAHCTALMNKCATTESGLQGWWIDSTSPNQLDDSGGGGVSGAFISFSPVPGEVVLFSFSFFIFSILEVFCCYLFCFLSCSSGQDRV